jgi:hypothetical protein
MFTTGSHRERNNIVYKSCLCPKDLAQVTDLLGKSIARRSQRGSLVSNVSISCEFNLRTVTLNSHRMLTSRGPLNLADWSSSSSSSSPAFHTESNATTAPFHNSRTRLTYANRKSIASATRMSRMHNGLSNQRITQLEGVECNAGR